MRIVIVDGKVDVQNAVKKILSDMGSEYELTGTASDGRSGYALITEENPDLVIMDLHLPKMNGLTMLKKLRGEHNRIKVLILTDDQDFNKARKAIELGVDQYLLKPVKRNQVRQSLIQINEKFKSEKLMEETLTVKNIFISYLNGRTGKDWKPRYIMKDRFGFTMEDPGAVMTVWLGNGYAKYLETVCTVLGKVAKSQGFSVCVLEIATWRMLAVIVYRVSDTGREHHYFAEHVVPQLCSSISGAVVCMWKDMLHLYEISDSLRELRNLCEWNLVFDRGRLITPEDIEKLEIVPLQHPVDLEERIKKAVMISDGEEIKKCFYRLYDLFRRDLYTPKDMKECLIRFGMAALEVYKMKNVLESEIQVQYSMQKITDAVSWEQIRAAMGEFLEQMSQEAFAEYCDERMSPLVKNAMQYVRKYYDQGITLEETANRLFVSDEYLSTQFKRETGKGFAETVRGLRIERIKDLLVNTHLKLNQIAELTGYSDPKYMSRVFKEEVGVLPSEYRKSAC